MSLSGLFGLGASDQTLVSYQVAMNDALARGDSAAAMRWHARIAELAEVKAASPDWPTTVNKAAGQASVPTNPNAWIQVKGWAVKHPVLASAGALAAILLAMGSIKIGQ